MKRIALEPGFILHRRVYRETSLILDVFSENHGRLALLAKGIRKKNNRLAGLLQPFVPLLMTFTEGSDLGILQEADLKGELIFITGNALIAALYLNELLVNFLQKSDVNTSIFHLYESTLMGLQGASLDEKIIRSFEIKLLSELGYGLFPRTEEAQLNAWQPTTFYRFHSTTGWVKCESNEVYQSFSYSGETILAIAKEEWRDDTILLQAKHLLRQVLTELMNNKPIYSRLMFIKIMGAEINGGESTDIFRC